MFKFVNKVILYRLLVGGGLKSYKYLCKSIFKIALMQQNRIILAELQSAEYTDAFAKPIFHRSMQKSMNNIRFIDRNFIYQI